MNTFENEQEFVVNCTDCLEEIETSACERRMVFVRNVLYHNRRAPSKVMTKVAEDALTPIK